MKCYACGFDLGTLEKIGYRTLCDKCQAWQHACVNCRYYQPGLPNDCQVPGTEWISDRQGANFCEEFALKKESFKKNSQEGKNKFNSLFKDD
jgi:hypothetical protein